MANQWPRLEETKKHRNASETHRESKTPEKNTNLYSPLFPKHVYQTKSGRAVTKCSSMQHLLEAQMLFRHLKPSL